MFVHAYQIQNVRACPSDTKCRDESFRTAAPSPIDVLGRERLSQQELAIPESTTIPWTRRQWHHLRRTHCASSGLFTPVASPPETQRALRQRPRLIASKLIQWQYTTISKSLHTQRHVRIWVWQIKTPSRSMSSVCAFTGPTRQIHCLPGLLCTGRVVITVSISVLMRPNWCQPS